MADPKTLEAIEYVLSRKIYPLSPELVRNDTRAAKLVAKFVFEVEVSIIDSDHIKYAELSQFERELQSTSYHIGLLFGMTNETIRKYISKLWRSGRFSGCIAFEKVKDE